MFCGTVSVPPVRADDDTGGVVGEGHAGSCPVDRYRIATTSLNADTGAGSTRVCIGQIAGTIGEAGAGGSTKQFASGCDPDQSPRGCGAVGMHYGRDRGRSGA